MKADKIGFGGSCHWCTEAVFQSLIGVDKVEQGWISATEATDFHEAVIVHYNPDVISLDVLVDVHLRTHNSTSDHSMRRKYRSAVYTFTIGQKEKVDELLNRLQKEFEQPLVTKSFMFKSFKTSEPSFHNYYRNNPDKPFCKSYIDPKLKLVLDRFSNHVSPT